MRLRCEICGKDGSEGFGRILCDDHANMVAEKVTECVNGLKPNVWFSTAGYYVIHSNWEFSYLLPPAAEALYQYMKQEKGE